MDDHTTDESQKCRLLINEFKACTIRLRKIIEAEDKDISLLEEDRP